MKGWYYNMKNVLITGAAGLLGSNIVERMIDRHNYNVIASDIDKSRIPKGSNIKSMSNDELFQTELLEINTVINCAFARGNNVSALVSALWFNEKLIFKLKEIGAKSILNISSQGLYKSLGPGQLASEDSEIEPYDLYAFAKFAQERQFTSNFAEKVTNIRMASLINNARFLLYFIERVVEGKDIVITAPNQYVSMLDARDAAEGIINLCDLPIEKRKQVYNLGTGEQYSILQIAEAVRRIGFLHGYSKTMIRIDDQGKCSAAGMSASRIKKETGWSPRHSLDSTINDLFLQKKEVQS